MELFAGGMFFIFWFFVGCAITVIPFWKICEKAGFNPAMSLLMLIPLVNFFFPFYLAFAAWPALERRRG